MTTKGSGQRFSLPRGLTSRGEFGQKFHLQLTFISFGAEFQCFCHARLRHIAGDTQIGLYGLPPEALLLGNEMLRYLRLSWREQWHEREMRRCAEPISRQKASARSAATPD